MPCAGISDGCTGNDDKFPGILKKRRSFGEILVIQLESIYILLSLKTSPISENFNFKILAFPRDKNTSTEN